MIGYLFFSVQRISRHFSGVKICVVNQRKRQSIEKAKEAGLSVNEFIITCSQRLQIDCTDYSPVITELKRIGNNLNQIARRLNSGGHLPPYFTEVVEGQRKIYDLILENMR